MFGNTFVIPHADGSITCIKINQDKYTSEYLSRRSTDEVKVRIRHSSVPATATKPAVDRHNVEYVQRVYENGAVGELPRKVYMVFEQSPADLDTKFVLSLPTWAIALAGANITSLINWES